MGYEAVKTRDNVIKRSDIGKRGYFHDRCVPSVGLASAPECWGVVP
jgi:hypothetical protein